MFHKPRYIHVQTPYGKKNGFSVLLSPHDNPHTVNVSVTYCSKKDQFCKKTARQELHFAKPMEIAVKSLPLVLSAFEIKSRGMEEIVARNETTSRAWPNLWAWVWKYFL